MRGKAAAVAPAEGRRGEEGYRRVTAVIREEQYAWAQEVVMSGAMAGLGCSVSTVIRLALEELRQHHPSAKKLEAALRAHIWREGVTRPDEVPVPAQRGRALRARVVGQPAGAPERQERRAIRVLLVVDQAMLRAGLRSLLADAPDVSVAGDVAEAAAGVRFAKAQRPDVALVDLSMGQDGTAAVEALVAAHPDLKVLVLGTSAERERILAAIEAGAVGYLIRDAAPEELLGGIRAAARGESPLSLPAALALLSEQPSRPPLTRRERQVLSMVARGLANKQIARQLGISEKTVKTHLGSTFQRLGVSDRTQAALWATRNGLLE